MEPRLLVWGVVVRAGVVAEVGLAGVVAEEWGEEVRGEAAGLRGALGDGASAGHIL